MITLADKKTLFQDRYQALLTPVPVSGVFRHRSLLRLQTLYPEYYTHYRQACERSELGLGQLLIYQTQRDLAGMGVGGALSKPKFIVSMGVTEFAENRPHLSAIQTAFINLESVLFDWGRYQGIRRVALLASDTLLLPHEADFDADLQPLIERYLQPISSLNLVVYR